MLLFYLTARAIALLSQIHTLSVSHCQVDRSRQARCTIMHSLFFSATILILLVEHAVVARSVVETRSFKPAQRGSGSALSAAERASLLQSLAGLSDEQLVAAAAPFLPQHEPPVPTLR